MFVGAHERQLDPKGRVALPAPFRPRLEPTCYLALGRDKCVDVLTADAFAAVAHDAMERVRRGEMTRTEQRALSSNILEVAVDAQGRIHVDDRFRAYAGLALGAPVVLSGSFDRVEIWEPARHRRISDAGAHALAGSE
jgi:MraZ protein